jgi:hypothetical protein
MQSDIDHLPKRRRRWFQFSLWTPLILVTLLAVPCWFVRQRLLLFVVFSGLLIVLCLTLFATTGKFYWHGSYSQAEFAVLFTDEAGVPIPRVRLSIENIDGVPSYRYPVTDFLTTAAPKSGTDGVMRFHHVARPMEFGGRSFFARAPSTPTLRYVCRFFLDQRAIYQCALSDLLASSSGARQVVTRSWDWREFLPIGDRSITPVQFFSANCRAVSRLAGESPEDAALNNEVQQLTIQLSDLRGGKSAPVQQLTFVLFRSTIVVHQR